MRKSLFNEVLLNPEEFHHAFHTSGVVLGWRGVRGDEYVLRGAWGVEEFVLGRRMHDNDVLGKGDSIGSEARTHIQGRTDVGVSRVGPGCEAVKSFGHG